MSTWSEFVGEAPDMAAFVERRLQEGRYALLGSLRADGHPRISGAIVSFADGELWLGMPANTVKVADLRHDGRMSLHSAPSPAGEGDAKVQGVAVEVAEGTQLDAFLARLPHEVPDGRLALFRIGLVDASLVRLNDAGDRHVIESWRAGEAGTRIRES